MIMTYPLMLGFHQKPFATEKGIKAIARLRELEF